MTTSSTTGPGSHAGVATHRIRAAAPLVLAALTLVSLSACAPSGGAPAATTAAAAGSNAAPSAGAARTVTGAEAVVPAGTMSRPTARDIDRVWAARPEFVRALPDDWQAAYAFALARPDVLQWLPCYCGCGAMGHRSNLDCFFQHREEMGRYDYEEHASFCDVCVNIANRAHQLLGQGKSMAEIRAAIDAEFGGNGAPGTDTAMPA